MSIVNCHKIKIMLEKHIVDCGQSDAHFPRIEQYYYRCIYFEALDLIVNGIQSRLFNQGIKSIRMLKTSFSRQFQEKISQVSHYQPAAFMIRYKQGTSWNAFYYFENACSRTFHRSVSSIIDLLNANGPALFMISETATVLKLILAMPATNTLTEWKVFQCLKKNQELSQVYYDAKKDELSYADVANDFYTGNSHRLSKIGNFSKVFLRWTLTL